MTLFVQQLLNGLALGSTYAIFAFGFGLVFATLGILNVAHGMFAAWGGLIALWFVEDQGWHFVPALVLGIIGAGLIGVAVDLLAFNPIRKREAGLLGSIIASIGVAIILGTLADQVTEHRTKRFPPGTFSEKIIEIGNVGLQFMQWVNIAVALVLAALALLAHDADPHRFGDQGGRIRPGFGIDQRRERRTHHHADGIPCRGDCRPRRHPVGCDDEQHLSWHG